MTWVKLDDGFWGNPKVVAVGNEAAGVYARVLSYCGCHETDGAIPDEVAKFIGRTRIYESLVQRGLLERLDNGYMVIGFLDFNPSKKTLEEKRAKDRNRKGGEL